MRLEHHLVGGYVRYISPHIIIIIIIIVVSKMTPMHMRSIGYPPFHKTRCNWSSLTFLSQNSG